MSLPKFVKGPPLEQEEIDDDEINVLDNPREVNIYGLPKFVKGPPIEKKEELPPEAESQEEFPFEEENDLEREVDRAKSMQMSRMIESIAGLPGSLQQGLQDITGIKGERQLPTISELRELSEKYSGGYTKPKNEMEEGFGELASDTALMALPGSRAYTLLRNVGIPVIANLSKHFLISQGVSKDKANLAKGMLMLGMDLGYQSLSLGGARGVVNELYQHADSLIPRGANMSSVAYRHSLLYTRRQMLRGGVDPTKRQAINRIDELIDIVDHHGNTIPIDELRQQAISNNRFIDEAGGFAFGEQVRLRTGRVDNMRRVHQQTLGALEQYGQTQNPQYYEALTAANTAHGALEGSNLASRFLERVLPVSFGSTATKTLFGLSHAGTSAANYFLHTPMITGSFLGMYNLARLMYRVWNSPELAMHYGRVIVGALSGNAPMVLKNAEALDKKLQEEEEESVLD